jgi:uncharacterized protein (TIGR02147 family)
MNISDYKDYRSYLKDYISQLPKNGRGFSARLADAIGVSPVIISQVLSDKRSFSLEQASDVANFIGLNRLEEEYFLELVQYDRAGSHRLKKFHERRLSDLKKKLQDVKNRVHAKKELDDKAKAFYYANWYLVAIRLLINNPQFHNPETLAEVLNLNLERVREALLFLEEYNLIEKIGDKYSWVGTSTHIPYDSPLVNRHHQNWRTQATKKMEQERAGETEIFFTAPMIIDRECAVKLRGMILKFIEESQAVSSKAPSKDLYCMNLDLFQVTMSE